MTEPSGRRWREPFARFDPDTSSWKTWQLSLPLENLPELPVTWPRSGTWDLGAAYALPMSALLTGVCGPSSLLPTPQWADGDRSSLTMVRGNPTLMGALLPTPTSRDWKDGSPNDNVEMNGLLGRKVWSLLPTPIAAAKHGVGTRP